MSLKETCSAYSFDEAEKLLDKGFLVTVGPTKNRSILYFMVEKV